MNAVTPPPEGEKTAEPDARRRLRQRQSLADWNRRCVCEDLSYDVAEDVWRYGEAVGRNDMREARALRIRIKTRMTIAFDNEKAVGMPPGWTKSSSKGAAD